MAEPAGAAAPARGLRSIKHPVFHDRYLQVGHLGRGTYARLHVGVDLLKVLDGVAPTAAAREAVVPREAFVAMKFQEMENNLINTLTMESAVFGDLAPEGETPPVDARVPRKLDFFCLEDGQHVLVMDLLAGLDAAKLRSRATTHFEQNLLPLRVALRLASEMLQCLRSVHARGYVHRDVKPNNFVQSGPGSRRFAVIDFGIARPYVEDVAASPAQRRLKAEVLEKPDRRGTTMYNSVHIHAARDHCRRDDLLSLWYVILDMISPTSLPWAAAARNKERSVVGDIKRRLHEETETVLAELGVMEALRAPFAATLARLHALGFADEPPYDELLESLEAWKAHAGAEEARGTPARDLGSWDWAKGEGERLAPDLRVFDSEGAGIARWLLCVLQLTSKNAEVAAAVAGHAAGTVATMFVRAVEGLRVHGSKLFKDRGRSVDKALREFAAARDDFIQVAEAAEGITFADVQRSIWDLDRIIDDAPRIRAFSEHDERDSKRPRL